MDSDEDVQMDTAEQSPWTAADKGKGKAVATEQDEQYDKENLPWCAYIVAFEVFLFLVFC